jgi:hypothetical protein
MNDIGLTVFEELIMNTTILCGISSFIILIIVAFVLKNLKYKIFILENHLKRKK